LRHGSVGSPRRDDLGSKSSERNRIVEIMAIIVEVRETIARSGCLAQSAL
jgi:hypothetical protein